MNRTSAKRGELLTAILSFRKAFTTVAVFSFFINFMMLTPSIYMLQVYDRVLASRNETTLLMLSLLIVGLYAMMSLLEAMRSFVLVRVGARLDLNLNARVFTAAYERSLIKAGSNPAQALHDLTTVRQALTGTGLFALMDAPWMPIYLVVIFIFSVPLGVFALAGALILIILAVINERISHPPLEAAQKLSMQASTMASNHLRNAEVIEAMGMLPQIRKRWFDVHHQFLQQQAYASDRAGLMSGLTKFVRIAMQSLVLGFGALLTIEGKVTAGMMIASSILVGRALAPVELLIGNWKQLVSAKAAYDRLQELLSVHPERKSGMPLPPPLGDVSLYAVAAVAPGTQQLILNNINLAIKAGEVVAIIGPSASGKSSLARLLVGVWGAARGTVRLDGADLYQWNKDDLGPYIGYLPQDIELFAGTVAENIARFGEIEPDKVIKAARLAGMHELILQFPKGYDTPLADAGSSLSGGQRQRLGLARALYGDPSFIVLDEPNSNLDDVGEKALVEAVKELKARGKTVVLITHRLNFLMVVDKILVMNEGTVKLYGPRDQVLAALAPPPPNPQAAGMAVARAG
jgi:ATP-binding cassette subfamily C exporter for protease/lipase